MKKCFLILFQILLAVSLFAHEFAKTSIAGEREMGLFTQDVKKVIPEAPHKPGGNNGTDYARLAPLLIEELKAIIQSKN